MVPFSSVSTLYSTWYFIRSFLHRGWWLVTSLYLVTEAGLSPFELVFLGTAQGLTVIAAEVPAGVFADAYSRKWSLVLAHTLMGMAMFSTGLVLSFPALVITQMIWGLSWTFSSGADVAWITDELNDPEKTTTVLIDAAKWGHAGSALGIVVLGALAWYTSLTTAIVAAGLGMCGLGALVSLLFVEHNFRRASAVRLLAASIHTLKQGLFRLRAHRVLVHILLYTFLLNGADEAFGRLYVKHLAGIGFPDPAAPIVWLSLLAIASLITSIVALNMVNRFLAGREHHARAYSVACGTGAFGFVLLSISYGFEFAAVAVIIIAGMAMSVMRTISIIWANKNATSDVRATIQSFLSLAENLGEVTLGFCLALIATYASIPAAMVASCVVLSCLGVLVETHSRSHRAHGIESSPE